MEARFLPAKNACNVVCAKGLWRCKIIWYIPLFVDVLGAFRNLFLEIHLVCMPHKVHNLPLVRLVWSWFADYSFL